MARVAPLQNSFNAGEWSPLLRAQVNHKKYPSAVQLLENFLPQIAGPARKRPGTRFVHEVADSSEVARLVPFEFSATQAFALCFNDGKIQFYANGGIVESSPGVPYTIATPYLAADLELLNFAQSADVVYLVHPSYAPRKLARLGPTNWTLTTVAFTRPPFGDLNATTTTITPSGTTGSITLTASSIVGINGGAGFSVSDIGRQVSIGVIPSSAYTTWAPGQSITAGNFRQYEGRVYQAVNSATTSTKPPLHSSGTESDGNVAWTYVSDGTGYATITAFTSTTVVSATVNQTLPTSSATSRWAFGAWSDVDGWPRAVTFYEDRLWFGGSTRYPQTLWASVTGDYENFTYGTNDDDGLSYTINTQDLNTITWLSPGKVLAIGTTNGEFTISGNQVSDPITPSSVRITPQTTFGCNGTVRPLRVASSVLFVQRAGRKIREYTYNFETDAYVAPNLNIMADHITESGIVDRTYQQEPAQIVWAPRADGVLAGMTYERAEDVVGWNRHTLGGAVESTIALPHWDGDQDVLWLIVNRTIGGVTKRYVEYMEKYMTDEESFFVDSGLTYSGVATTTITGLSHLEGEEVAVLTNGATHPTRTVSGGQITLAVAATVAVVGVPFTARIRTFPFEAGSQNGTSQGKPQRISGLSFELIETGPGLWYGTDEQMDEYQMRNPGDNMDEPVPLFTGTTESQAFPGGYELGAGMLIEHRLPLPCTIAALMPTVATYDR